MCVTTTQGNTLNDLTLLKDVLRGPVELKS